MYRMLTKLTSVGVALALCLMGTASWVSAQNDLAVTDSMLLADPAASWLHTNGNLAGHRYSVLTQLNTSNADRPQRRLDFLAGRRDRCAEYAAVPRRSGVLRAGQQGFCY